MEGSKKKRTFARARTRETNYETKEKERGKQRPTQRATQTTTLMEKNFFPLRIVNRQDKKASKVRSEEQQRKRIMTEHFTLPGEGRTTRTEAYTQKQRQNT